MITEGEWEAMAWFFKIYSRLAIQVSLKFHWKTKKISPITAKKEKMWIHIIWTGVIVYNLLHLISFSLLLSQNEKVSAVQMIFNLLYLFIHSITIVPGLVFSFYYTNLVKLVNSITSINDIGNGF